MKISRTRIIRVFNLIPLILGLGLIPLMVQVRKITTLPIERIAWRDIDWYVDFFARSKFEVLLLAAIIAAVLSLYHMRTHTDQVLYKYYMLLLAFMVLVVISTLSERYIPYLGQNFSAVSYNVDYVMTETTWNVGFWGFPERYEGLLAMVSYFALFILSIKVLREEIDYKILVIVMAISSGIIGLIGLTQFVGMDLFKTDLGRFLISLTSKNVDITATRYTVADSVIYSTLYNPNYVGSYICLILPVIISVWLVVRKKWLKWLGGALIVLLALNIAGSKSLTGFIGLFASMVVWLVFNRHNIKKNYKKWLPIIGVISIGLGLFIGLSTADIAVKVRTNVGELAQVVVGSEVVSNTELIEHVYELDGGVFIETTYRGLYVGRIDAATYVFADMDANALELIPDDSGYYVFADARYNDLQVEFFNAGSIIKVNMADIPVVFQFVGSKVYALGQNYNLYDTDYEVPSFGFADHQTFGTKRGYIWSKTLPLLKDHLVVGTGPDTFAIVFPQYDYIGKTNMYHEPGQIVDKPHNMYLQIALQTGVLSLVIFLSFMMVYFIYFLKTYKVYRDVHPSKFLYHLNIGIALSLLGYLVAGIGNDTTIATSSVFWILLGTGISLQITNHLSEDITE